MLTFRRRSDPLLVAVDGATAAAVAFAAYRVRFAGELPLLPDDASTYRVAGLGLVVSWVLIARSTGLYRRASLRPGSSNLPAAGLAAVLVGVALLLADYTAFHGDLDVGWIGLVVLGLALGGLLARALMRRSRRALVPLGLALERYAVLGTGPEADRVAGELAAARKPIFVLVARLPAGLGDDELVSALRAQRIDGLVVTPGDASRGKRLRERLADVGVDVVSP
ncbi:MAG TPA: hypothetical protein VM097_08785 [Mycobacteriales bacterium]|nr:hypothetical protein [Mycobacteriales bacterium]